MRKYKFFLLMFIVILFTMFLEVSNAANIALPRYFTVPVGEILDLTQYEMEIQKKEILLPSESPKLTWSFQDEQEDSEQFLNETQFISNRVGWTSACVNEEEEEEEVCLPILVTDDHHEVVQEADRLTYIERDLPIIWAHDIQRNPEEALAQIVKEHIKFSDVHITDELTNRMFKLEDIDPNQLSVTSDYKEGDTWADISVFLDDVMIYEDIFTIADERYKPEGEGWEFLPVDQICLVPEDSIGKSVYRAYGIYIDPQGEVDEKTWKDYGTAQGYKRCKDEDWRKEDITVLNPLNRTYGQLLGMGTYLYPVDLVGSDNNRDIYRKFKGFDFSHRLVGVQIVEKHEIELRTYYDGIEKVRTYGILPFYSVISNSNFGFNFAYPLVNTTSAFFLLKEEGESIVYNQIYDGFLKNKNSNSNDITMTDTVKNGNADVNIWRRKGDDEITNGLVVVKPFISVFDSSKENNEEKYTFSGKLTYNEQTGYIDIDNRIYNNNDTEKTIALMDIQALDKGRFLDKEEKKTPISLIDIDNKQVGFQRDYTFGSFKDPQKGEVEFKKSSDKKKGYFHIFDVDTNLNWTIMKDKNFGINDVLETYKNLNDKESGVGIFNNPDFNIGDINDAIAPDDKAKKATYPTIVSLSQIETIEKGGYLSKKLSIMAGENFLFLTAQPSQVEAYDNELKEETIHLTTKDPLGNLVSVDKLHLYVDGKKQDQVESGEDDTILYKILEIPEAPQEPGFKERKYTFQTRLNTTDRSNIVTIPVRTYTFGAVFDGFYPASPGQSIPINDIIDSESFHAYYIKNRGELSYQWIDHTKCTIQDQDNPLSPGEPTTSLKVPDDSQGTDYKACLNMTQKEGSDTRSFNVTIPIRVGDGTDNPRIIVPPTLIFENIGLPVPELPEQDKFYSYRDTEDWGITVKNIDNPETYKVVISQKDYFSLKDEELDKELTDGIFIVYKNNPTESPTYLHPKYNIDIPLDDFNNYDNNKYVTQWSKEQGLILEYTNKINNSLPNCNKFQSCKYQYQTRLEFSLQSTL